MAKRQNHRRDRRAAQMSALDMARARPDDDGGVASLMASSLGELPWLQLLGGGARPEPMQPDERLFDALAALGASPPSRGGVGADPFAAPVDEGAQILAFLRSKMSRGSAPRRK